MLLPLQRGVGAGCETEASEMWGNAVAEGAELRAAWAGSQDFSTRSADSAVPLSWDFVQVGISSQEERLCTLRFLYDHRRWFPLQHRAGKWKWMIFKIPFNLSHPTILMQTLLLPQVRVPVALG